MRADGGRTPEQVRSRFRLLKGAVTLALLLGFLLNIGGRNLARWVDGEDSRGLAAALRVAGLRVMLASGVVYARLKGRSGWWGLVGLLGCLGYFVLLFMEKQCLRCGTRSKDRADECPSCGAPV
jgi:hypothetical protein